MKSKKPYATSSLLLIGLLFISLFGFGTAMAQEQEVEQKVKMKDLPPAVQKTVEEQSKGAKLRGLAKEIKNGQTFYEAELKINGHSKDVLMDENGNVVEVEEQVTLESLPAVVKAEILKQAGRARIRMIESISKGAAIVGYEAHIRKGFKIAEIKVDPDGKLMAP
jgi:uncharacterized membrane protein YkoI